MGEIGKLLIGAGLVLVVVGLIMFLGGRFGIGRLPGDFVLRRGNFTFYFPLLSSIIISVVLSLVFWLLRR